MLPALLALLALWLVPGLALVAAPWPAVPLLSVAFWLCSWGLTDLLGLSREAALRSTLLLFGLLVLLRLPRLPRLPQPPRPSLAALAVAGTALLGLGLGAARLAPLPRGALAPALALDARLLVARDGWPRTQAPFWSARDFETPPGLAWLAADVGLLSGADVGASLLAVALGARGLLACALLLALRRLRAPAWSEPWAALPSCLLHAATPWRAQPAELAVALGLAGGALLARGRTRAPAAAAGLLLAGALAAEARVGALALALALAQAGRAWWTAGAAERGPRAGRAAVAALLLACGSLALRHGPSRAVAPAAEPEPALDAHDLAAFRWLRENSPPAAVVCCPDPGRAAWLPALGERRPAQPGERCALAYVREPQGLPPGARAFRAGPVQIVEIP